MTSTVNDCLVIELGQIKFAEGSITVLENNKIIPFNVERVFFLYDIPGGACRGAHSHKLCHQFIVSASGSFEVQIDDGFDKKVIYLNQPYRGLYIPPGIWASEINFSSGAISLVLASHKFDEKDYIRDYSEFLKSKK